MPKSEYDKQREQHIFDGRPVKKKERKRIKPISDKRRAKQEAEEKPTETMYEFFTRMRPAMTGVCQCGCKIKSQKDSDALFYFCICHIFPQRMFQSIAKHEQNWVERTFVGGHHHNMDNLSIRKWKGYADWENIKRKFKILEPLLTEKEKTKKFYHNLKQLVYEPTDN